MVALAHPAPAGPTYVKVANFPRLYRHARSGRYYACKKLGVRRERSLQTSDRKIAERRLKEWIGNLDKVNAEVEKTTLGGLIARFEAVNGSTPRNSQATTNAIIQCFLRWWPHGTDFQVRHIRPSSLDGWLALQEPRLRNTTYNRYAGFLKQLFDIAVKDRIIAESPAKQLRLPWKKPQVPKRIIPSPAEFAAIVQDIRLLPLTSPQTRHTEDTADFLEFLGLAGLGQAKASSLTWGDIDWQRNRISARRRPAHHGPLHRGVRRGGRGVWLLAAASSARCRLTATWQVAVLPSAPQSWRCTPAEWRPAFGKARLVNDPVGRRRGGRGPGQGFQEHVRRLRTLADEVLQVLVALAESGGHRLDALALAVQEQPAHLHARPAPPLRPAQPSRQLGEKTFQAPVQPLQLTRLHAATLPRRPPSRNQILDEVFIRRGRSLFCYPRLVRGGHPHFNSFQIWRPMRRPLMPQGPPRIVVPGSIVLRGGPHHRPDRG